jgi:hypothetical protein
LSDALNATISMNFKLKEEMNYLLVLDALIDDASSFYIELVSLARNIKKEVCGGDRVFPFLVDKT